MRSGFSLIEVLVSLSIIGMFIVLSGALVKALPLSRHVKYQDTAIAIASDKLESLRSGGYDSLPASGSFTSPALSTLPSGSANIAVQDYATGVKRVAVTVSWTEAGRTTPSQVALTTLVASVGGLP